MEINIKIYFKEHDRIVDYTHSARGLIPRLLGYVADRNGSHTFCSRPESSANPLYLLPFLQSKDLGNIVYGTAVDAGK
jgi:hypothetical protein